jgi:hypothetical protein
VASLPSPERNRNSCGPHSAAAHEDDRAGRQCGDQPDESATADAGSRGHDRNHSCAHSHLASHPVANAHVVRAAWTGAEAGAGAATRTGTRTADPDARASRSGSGTWTAHPDAATDPGAGTSADTTRPDATTRTRTRTPRPDATTRTRTGTHTCPTAATRSRARAAPSARARPGAHTAAGPRTAAHTIHPASPPRPGPDAWVARPTTAGTTRGCDRARTGAAHPENTAAGPAHELRRTTAGTPRSYRPEAREPGVP